LLGLTQKDNILDAVAPLKSNPYLLVFTVLALCKGVKIVIHTFSYYFLTYPPYVPYMETYDPDDVTVIISTNGKLDNDFETNLRSITRNNPTQVIVIVELLSEIGDATTICRRIDPSKITVRQLVRNKREQFLAAADQVQTLITCHTDSHFTWSNNFLRNTLAEFEDPIVGLVGTRRLTKREKGRNLGFLNNFLNYLSCIDLARQNFENTASYNIDGGVSVIAGRPSLIRTEILTSIPFRYEFQNESWLWGARKSIDIGDDYFITRYMVKKGFKTVFHNQKSVYALSKCDFEGGFSKFVSRLVERARCTWRSNSISMFVDRKCWWKYPWTTYAMLISSFYNFSILYDPAMAYTLYKATGWKYIFYFLGVLFASKFIKSIRHLWRRPGDFIYALGGILFGYFHSFLKLWALLTVLNIKETPAKSNEEMPGIIPVPDMAAVQRSPPIAPGACRQWLERP